jgi:hypothetical protein
MLFVNVLNEIRDDGNKDVDVTTPPLLTKLILGENRSEVVNPVSFVNSVSLIVIVDVDGRMLADVVKLSVCIVLRLQDCMIISPVYADP